MTAIALNDMTEYVENLKINKNSDDVAAKQEFFNAAMKQVPEFIEKPLKICKLISSETY